MLHIFTSDPDYAHLEIPVTVTKSQPVRLIATPAQVELRLAPSAATAAALVRLRSPSGQPVRIAKVASAHGALTCTWAAGPGNDATLKVQVAGARLRKDDASSAVVVVLEDDPQATLTIPVRVIRE
jgi:hypothetical protein